MHALIEVKINIVSFNKSGHGAPAQGYHGHRPGYHGYRPGYHGHSFLDLTWQAYIGIYGQN